MNVLTGSDILIAMRIGLSTAAFYGRLETEDAAEKVASLGIPCCEVFLETYSEYKPAFGELLRERLGHTSVTSIHSTSQHFEAGILGQSARQRGDAFGMMDSFLRAGKAMGAGVYVYHGPACLRGATPRIDAWHDGIAQAIEMASAYGIDLSWETVSWCHLNAPERVRDFRKAWPGLHFVLDVKQVQELGQGLLAYVDAMGEKLRHVHILDRDADGRLVLPGKGVHDFKDFARALRANGYQGDVILEPYANVVPDDASLMASMDWLAETFAMV